MDKARFLLTLILPCILFLVCSEAEAIQDAKQDDSEYQVELERILITPRRVHGLTIGESEFPGNATVITAEDIERSNAQDIQDVLVRREGITLIDTIGFGLGSDSGLNLRGILNSARTNALVLVDGVRQNTITDDGVHWQGIPLEHIERIEIIRGGSGTIYGEGALAGVINIITKKGGIRPAEAEGKVEFGSFGQAKQYTAIRGREKAFSYGIDFSRKLIDGYRDYSSSRNSTSDIFLGYELSEDSNIEANILYHRDTSYNPGSITKAQAEAYRRSAGSFGFFDNEIKNVSVRFTDRLKDVVGVDINAFIRDQRGDSNFGSVFRNITPSKGISSRLGYDLEQWGIKNTVIIGFDLTEEKATTGSVGSKMSETDRTASGLYIEDTISLSDNLSIIGGFRYDRSKYLMDLTFPSFKGTARFEGRAPKIGVTYRPDKDLDVYLNYSRSFKAPNISDMDAVLTGFFDNVNIEPQLADNYEFGLRLKKTESANLKLTYFQTRIDNEIMFNPFTFSNDNFDTRRDGMEFSLNGRLVNSDLSYYLNYTFVKAKFTKGTFDNFRIPITPEHTVNSGLQWKITKELDINLDWIITNRQFRVNDFNNRLPADNYGYLNMGLKFKKPNYNIYLRAQNLTNEEYVTFQSSDGTSVSNGENPAPPINFVVGFEYKL